MKIVWIWAGNGDEQSRRSGEGDSFKQHAECMRKFRLAHPDKETTNSRVENAAESLASLPVQVVRLPRNVQN